jgi:hypothetical protein
MTKAFGQKSFAASPAMARANDCRPNLQPFNAPRHRLRLAHAILPPPPPRDRAMPAALHFKPAHQPIKEYYAALEAYRGHDVTHASRRQNCLPAPARSDRPQARLHLVPEQSSTVRGKSIRPDGTLRDSFNLHRGYWEAKDSADKL